MNESTVSNAESLSGPADASSAPAAPPTGTAGTVLKKAREEAGLHIAALAAALKVPVRKLEALEANRWEELTDATFTRALASSVARHLKLDPAAVLLAMPSGKPVPLVISGGLGNANSPRSKGPLSSFPVLGWGIAALLVAALAIYLWPKWWPAASTSASADVLATPEAASSSAKTDVAAAPDAPPPLATQVQVSSETVPPAPASSPAAPVVTSTVVDLVGKPAPTAPTTPAPTAPTTPAPAASATLAAPTTPPAAVTAPPAGGDLVLVIKANSDTWAEVIDDSKRVRVQRLLKAGEEQSFNGAGSFSVVLGNAMAAQVFVRGQALDLMSRSKNNVARFDIK